MYFDAGHSLSLTSPSSWLSVTVYEDLRNIRLISSFLLAADCLQQDGSYASCFLDLNGYIGRSNGEFSRDFNFSNRFQNISLNGTMLRGRLKLNSGILQESLIDISRTGRCLNGRLLSFKGLRPHDDD